MSPLPLRAGTYRFRETGRNTVRRPPRPVAQAPGTALPVAPGLSQATASIYGLPPVTVEGEDVNG